jgi:hypothetical protein
MKTTEYIKLFLILFCILVCSGARRLYAGLPDLTLTNTDIVFSNTSPEPGEVITISATIRNNGDIYFDPVPPAKHDAPTGTLSGNVWVWRDYWYAQYFTPSSDLLLGRVELYCRNAGSTADAITVQIRKDKGYSLLPSSYGEDLLASKTLVSTFTTNGWQDFNFDDPPLLTAGSTYWICVENNAPDAANGYAWRVDTGTPTNMLSVSYLLQGQEWTTVNGEYAGYFKVYRCTDTVVSCYQGDPSNGGTLIATSIIRTPLSAGESRTVSFPWTAVAGNNNIYVTVDYPGFISENLENNNNASQTITVTATSPGIDGPVSPPENAVGVSVTAPASVAFSEEMDPALAAAAVSVKAVTNNTGAAPAESSVAGTAAYANKTVTFTGSWKKGYTYQVTISTAATDLYGNGIVAPKVWTFTTLLDCATENTVTTEDARTSILLPQGILTDDYYVVIDTDAGAVPSLSQKIAQANDKLQRIKGSFSSPVDGHIRKFTLYRNGAPCSESFQQSARIVIPYVEAENGMIRDANGRLVKEKTLRIYRLDENSDLWVQVPDAQIDTVNNTVTARVNHFSIYAIFGAGDTDLSAAYAYPMPWKPFAGNSETGSLEGGITFTGLGSQATIRIYTLSGELVKTLQYQYTGGAEQQQWDGTNLDGELVASGVYLYYIENEKEHTSGKLIIIK